VAIDGSLHDQPFRLEPDESGYYERLHHEKPPFRGVGVSPALYQASRPLPPPPADEARAHHDEEERRRLRDERDVERDVGRVPPKFLVGAADRQRARRVYGEVDLVVGCKIQYGGGGLSGKFPGDVAVVARDDAADGDTVQEGAAVVEDVHALLAAVRGLALELDRAAREVRDLVLSGDRGNEGDHS